MERIAALLLAAGRSERMGAFKPLLPFGGRTVIETCVVNLREAGAAPIIAVIGHRAAELRAVLDPLGVITALNHEAQSEMSVSIARGVELVPGEAGAVIIALADQPAIPATTIRRVMEAHGANARLVVPEHGGRGGHPVLVDLSFREQLLHLDPQRGLRALFAAHRDEVRRVPVDSPYIARDMDTWQDYCALHKEMFGVLPHIRD
jgi:CTP:molybdopterin cytidylyltransferase MocA